MGLGVGVGLRHGVPAELKEDVDADGEGSVGKSIWWESTAWPVCL